MLNGIKQAAGAMGQAQKMKAQQDKFQKLLSGIRVTGTSKNSKVSVIITGEQKIIDIQIEPALITFVKENFIDAGKEDKMLSKSIIEAVDDAIAKVQSAVVQKIQETGSLGDLMGMLQAAGNQMGQ